MANEGLWRAPQNPENLPFGVQSALKIRLLAPTIKKTSAIDTMTYSSASEDDLQHSIEQSLQEMAAQIGQPISARRAEQLYQEAVELLSHVACAPITLARVAGTLLVYQMQNSEPEVLEWFRDQVQHCSDDEEVEELIESIHRIDTL